MTERKVNNMDIISDAGAVGRVVIVAENIKMVKFADCNLCDIRHKVVRDSVRVLAHCAAFVRTDWVEIAQQANAPRIVACIQILQNALNHKLCSSIWVCNSADSHIFRKR